MSETRVEIVTDDPTLENLHELCQKYPPSGEPIGSSEPESII